MGANKANFALALLTAISAPQRSFSPEPLAAINPDDLPSFRLTNSHLRQCSIDFFAKQLTDRRFILSPYSLQGLVDLTAHPVFGTLVQSIALATHQFKPEDDSCHSEHSKQAAAKQYHFIDTGQHVRMLSDALSYLDRHHVIPTLAVFQDICDVSNAGNKIQVKHMAYGYDELYSSEPVRLRVQSVPGDAVDAWISASHHAGVPIKRLVLRLGWYKESEDTRGWNITKQDKLDYQIRRLLLNESDRELGRPTISIKPGIDLTIAFHTGHTDPTSRLSIKDADRSLQLLAVSVASKAGHTPLLDDHNFGTVAEAVYQEHFRSISINRGFIDSTLVSLLRAHARILRHLDLDCNNFIEGPASRGIDLLTFIKHELTLESLRITCIAFIDGNARAIERRLEAGVIWHGSEEINHGLTDLISSLSAWPPSP
ncbi:hypothetical protein E4T39_07144 [Aureobasidium subglaciale]|nr:hypothetical protein E4T39_07144 [Aureobasidium subglaciale]